MVHTVVVASLIIGIAAIPVAMADYNEDNKDEKKCLKWFSKAIKKYQQKGFVPPGYAEKVEECLEAGFKSPTPLPFMEIPEDDKLPMNGLKINLMMHEVIVNNVLLNTVELQPCTAGEIIFAKGEVDTGGLAVSGVDQEISLDRTTLWVEISNRRGVEGIVSLVMPCLGLNS